MQKNHFRLLLIAPLLLVILGAINDYFFSSEALDSVYNHLGEVETTLSDWGAMILGILAFISLSLSVTALIGLFLFRPWGRVFYIVAFALLAPITPFMGISVASGTSQVLYDLSMAISGAIVVLVYYSPIASYFKDRE